MFCPGCGSEELGTNQFCRSCGADLRPVRVALERPDAVTASAVNAREEIGRAIAAKIRETRSVKDLARVTEEVLPGIEKFLEGPQERRLRRIRLGTQLSSIGAGVGIAAVLLGIQLKEEFFLVVAGAGVVLFFIGLGVVINGLLHSLPRTGLRKADEEPALLQVPAPAADALPQPGMDVVSVTENTTAHLHEKPQ